MCDSIFVDNIRYNAVDPTSIVLDAYSISTTGVDYPSFILFDGNGDTLAIETVNFFILAFGQPQQHVLSVKPGAQVPQGAFDGTLELYKGFWDTLLCSWDLQGIELCPPDSCVQAEIYLTNTGMLEAFPTYWWIVDQDNGNWVADGNFDMDLIQATHFDTTCLAPGNYILEFTPFSPIDEEYVVGITDSYWNSAGTNTIQQGDSTPLDLSFGWYEECADISNGITEVVPSELTAVVSGNAIDVRTNDGTPFGVLSLYSAHGTLIDRRTNNTDRIRLSIEGIAPGIHILHAQRPDGRTRTIRIHIP